MMWYEKRMSPKAAKTDSPNSMTKLTRGIERILFSSKEKQAFLEDLATLIDDGVPATRAVAVINTLSKGATKALSESILLKIAQGKSIADGMLGWMPSHIVELIRAGETGGTLVQNLRVAGETLGRKNLVVGSLVSALTYPLVVLLIGIIVLMYLKSSIFGQFADIKPVAEWPAEGQRLMAMATFIQNWWLLIIMVAAAVAFAINKMLQNVVGNSREIIDKVPLLSIYKQVTAARFMETLGLLVSNGIVFKQSLKIMNSQANHYLGWHLMMMERRLAGGRANIAEVLDTGLVSRGDILRLRAIADAKGFEHALVRLGRQSANNVVQTMQKLAKILGGILLALGAGLAILMVLGIYAVGSSLAT